MCKLARGREGCLLLANVQLSFFFAGGFFLMYLLIAKNAHTHTHPSPFIEVFDCKKCTHTHPPPHLLRYFAAVEIGSIEVKLINKNCISVELELV